MTLQPLSQEQSNRLKKIATIASVSLAVSLSLLKTFGALYTGSLAVLSSMIDSLADIFASSVTYIAVKYASKPASDNHRYGYGKAEALSALIQSAFIAGSGIFVMYDRYHHNGHQPCQHRCAHLLPKIRHPPHQVAGHFCRQCSLCG